MFLNDGQFVALLFKSLSLYFIIIYFYEILFYFNNKIRGVAALMQGFHGRKMRSIPENVEWFFTKHVKSLHLINVEVLNEKTSLAVLLQVSAVIESQGGHWIWLKMKKQISGLGQHVRAQKKLRTSTAHNFTPHPDFRTLHAVVMKKLSPLFPLPGRL